MLHTGAIACLVVLAVALSGASAANSAELVFDGILGHSGNPAEPLPPLPEGVVWQPEREMDRNAYTSHVGRAVACAGKLAETGELLVGTGYPESRLHLFAKDGHEILEPPWPLNGWYAHIVQAGGRTWGLMRGARAITRTLQGKRPLVVGGREAEACSGIAVVSGGYWLKTHQGWLYYAASDPTRCVRRHGDLSDVTALVILRGMVYVFRHSRIDSLWLDDLPDEAWQGSDFDGGRAAGRWTGTVDAAEIADGKIRYSFSREGKHFLLDPSVTDWSHRAKREYSTDRPVARKSNQAVLPKGFMAIADGKSLILKDKRGKTIQTLPVAATLVASEGEWLVAYVPAEKALRRFHLNNYSNKSEVHR